MKNQLIQAGVTTVFHLMGVNVYLSIAIGVIAAIVYILFPVFLKKRQLKKIDELQKQKAEEDRQAELDKDIHVKVFKNGQVIHGIVPATLKEKFRARFGDERELEIDDYNNFLTKHMTNEDVMRYFSDNKKVSDELMAKMSVPQTFDHLGSKQNHHISYFNKQDRLVVITELGGDKITQRDKESFTEYVKLNKKKGEKVTEEDVKAWANTEGNIRLS